VVEDIALGKHRQYTVYDAAALHAMVNLCYQPLRRWYQLDTFHPIVFPDDDVLLLLMVAQMDALV
jgi:hypothetical protein